MLVETFANFLYSSKYFVLAKLFGLQWQGTPSKDVPGEYWIRFPEEQCLTSTHASKYETD
jgi:hypothetical protein